MNHIGDYAAITRPPRPPAKITQGDSQTVAGHGRPVASFSLTESPRELTGRAVPRTKHHRKHLGFILGS